MTEFVKETVVTQGNTTAPGVIKPVKILATGTETAERLVYYFFGALEILLVFRLLLKIAGANTYSAFVGLVYGITGIFIVPFTGIFQQGYAQGNVTTSIFEPATLVAIIVYVVIAWGIVKLLGVLSGEQQQAA